MSVGSGNANSGDELDDEFNQTVQEQSNNQLLELVRNLQLQMDQMKTNLNSERQERRRLEDILQKQTVNHPEPSQVSSPPQYSSVFHQQNEPLLQPTPSNVPMPTFPRPTAIPFESSTTTNANFQCESNLPIFGARKKIIDLLLFSGRPEEWPAFNVAFVESNKHMNYSDWENHIRLMKALTGAAKENVQALLIHPSNVNMVIAELQRMYGQSQHLLKSQQEKVRKIQPISENRLDLLIPFATKVRNFAAFLETINSVPHLANPNIIEELVQKLPPNRRVDWGMHALTIKPFVTVRHFSDWLSNLAHVVSTVNVAFENNSTNKKKPKEVLHATTTNTNSSKNAKPTCKFCKNEHNLGDCKQFKEKSIDEKLSFLKSKRMCFSCLKYGHLSTACSFKKTCNINGCQKIHHETLHDYSKDESSSAVNHITLNCASYKTSKEDLDVLFKIVPIKLYGTNDRCLQTYAMIDEGSSVTLAIKKLPIVQYKNAKPLVLIRLNHSFIGAPMKTIGEKCWNSPIAVKTKLGWVVYGPCDGEEKSSSRCHHMHHITFVGCGEDDQLSKKMEDYFSLDNFGVKMTQLESEVDKRANHILKTTTTKLRDRFQTGLLWKDSNVKLPNSYAMAKRRLLSNEKKFRSNPSFKEKYTEMMNNNFEKGYARK